MHFTTTTSFIHNNDLYGVDSFVFFILAEEKLNIIGSKEKKSTSNTLMTGSRYGEGNFWRTQHRVDSWLHGEQVAAGVNETVSYCEGEKTSTDRKSRDDLDT